MSNMNSAEVDQMVGNSVSETSVGLVSSESGNSSNETTNMSNNADNANANNSNAQVDIKEFIHGQLKENIRDRLFMLNIERDLINFIKNEKDEYYKFQAMNPYYRMLTHRICDYFGLGHNLDNLKQSVIVFKLADKTRMPLVNFQTIINTSTNVQQQVNSQALVTDSGSAYRSDSSSSSSKSLTPNTSSNNLNALQQEQKVEKKQILKRDVNDQENEALRNKQLQNRRASDIKPKTFEEKSAEYNRIKNRIFNDIHENEPKKSTAPQNSSQSQKTVSVQNTIQTQQTEVKQYKILNRPNKPIMNESNEINGHGQQNKNQNQKKNQTKPQQQQQQQQQQNIHKKPQQINQNYKPVVQQQQQGAFRPGQIVTPFPQQIFFMNQNPNLQFTNTPQVVFPTMTQLANVPPFQMIPNQTPGIIIQNQVPPFLQIPNNIQTNSQKNSPVRPKIKPKFYSPMTRKPQQAQVQTKTNDKIKNIKFQVYNLSNNLTRAKLNELLGPYVHKMEILNKNGANGMNDENNQLLDESSIDILIEFDDFDKLEEAFKDLNLNGTNQQQSTRPFLIKPVC